MGYVLLGPISKAISRLGLAMDNRKSLTQQRLAFASNNSLCPDPHTHRSSHLQHGTSRIITLVHIFADFS